MRKKWYNENNILKCVMMKIFEEIIEEEKKGNEEKEF